MSTGGEGQWIEDGIHAAKALVDGDARSRWSTTVLHGTGGGTFGGSAIVELDSPEERYVVKLVRRNDTAADHPLNWRRELDVYESTWLQDKLPDGIALPHCHASTVTDSAAVIVMEAVDFDDRDHRSVDWYADLAVELGRLSGATLDAHEPPHWATRNFIAHEMEAALEVFPAMLAEPLPVIRELEDRWRPHLRRLTTATSSLVAALDDEPTSLNHLDIFSRNATRVGDRFVLIDWAYTGVAPIGSDAAAVIVVSGIFGDVPVDDFDAFIEAVVSSFVRGVGETGAELPASDVRRCIDQEMTLRFAKFLTQLHGIGDGIPAVIERVSGRSFEDALSSWLALADALAPCVERTLAAVDA
jgi:hypothetical protein